MSAPDHRRSTSVDQVVDDLIGSSPSKARSVSPALQLVRVPQTAQLTNNMSAPINSVSSRSTNGEIYSAPPTTAAAAQTTSLSSSSSHVTMPNSSSSNAPFDERASVTNWRDTSWQTSSTGSSGSSHSVSSVSSRSGYGAGGAPVARAGSMSSASQTSSVDAAGLQALLKERDLLRLNVKRVQDENRELRDRFAAERDVLHERIVALEYDVAASARSTAISASSASSSSSTTADTSTAAASRAVPSHMYDALVTQHNALLDKIVVYQTKLADWEAWKVKAELITQDLAKRLKEEQKIRRKLDALLQSEQSQQHQQQQQQQQQQFDAEHQRDNSGGSSRSNGLFGFLTSSANGTDVVLANGAHYASTVPLSRMPTSSSSSSLSTLSTQERAASAGAVADAVSPSKEFSISVHHL